MRFLSLFLSLVFLCLFGVQSFAAGPRTRLFDSPCANGKCTVAAGHKAIVAPAHPTARAILPVHFGCQCAHVSANCRAASCGRRLIFLPRFVGCRHCRR